jgi:phosphohistidine swiveling domain-containing protein
MNLEETLVELRKTLLNWGISTDEWALILHYADKLQGYDLIYDRDEHLHIIISADKIPWKNEAKVKNDEIPIPRHLPYSRNFKDFMKKTGYDFHLICGETALTRLLFRKHSILHGKNRDKIRLITTLGNMIFIKNTVQNWSGKYSDEVITRRLSWVKLVREKAIEKNDNEVTAFTEDILTKYMPDSGRLEELSNEEMQNFKKTGKIKGMSAFHGRARGEVVIIENPDRPPVVESGKIIVSKLASPKLVSEIRKSIAVITDEGGRLSHAAILCLEFGIPCIVGTKIATKVLKNGEKIIVDADNGIIRRVDTNTDKR